MYRHLLYVTEQAGVIAVFSSGADGLLYNRVYNLEEFEGSTRVFFHHLIKFSS